MVAVVLSVVVVDSIKIHFSAPKTDL